MPIHAQLNEQILSLQREFRQGEGGGVDGEGKERVSDVLLLSSSALTRACGMALLKQARWTVREAPRLVTLSDMIYGDVRQVIKRQHQERMPSGFTAGTSGLAGAALDVSTDATIAAAVASRNCHKGGERSTPHSPTSLQEGVDAYPTLPVGMQMSKVVVVDAILHETPDAVASTLRTLERQTGVRLVLCYITDERPTAGVGYRLHSSCTLSEEALYNEGYDLVIQQCLDHSTVRMLTSIFIPQSQLFERGVASGARTVTGNYAKIRHILGEVTDRSGVAAPIAAPADAASVGFEQLMAHHSSAVASSSLAHSFTTRGRKEALMSAQTIGPSTLDCIDTHPDYLKVLARYEYSLQTIEKLQKAMQSSKVVDTDKGAELEQVRLELDEAYRRIDTLTEEVNGLRKSELLVDQVIHTNNRVRDAHQRNTLSHTLAIYKDKYLESRGEAEGRSLEISGLHAEITALKAQLSSAQQVSNFPLPSSRRVSGSLFSRPQLEATPVPISLNKYALGDFAALLESTSLLAHDFDSGAVGNVVAVPSLSNDGRQSLNFAEAADKRRSNNTSQLSPHVRSSSSLALSMSISVRNIATQTPPISWAGALPLEEIEDYLQVTPGSLGKTATASDTLDAITQHIVSHLTTTLSSRHTAPTTVTGEAEDIVDGSQSVLAQGDEAGRVRTVQILGEMTTNPQIGSVPSSRGNDDKRGRGPRLQDDSSAQVGGGEGGSRGESRSSSMQHEGSKPLSPVASTTHHSTTGVGSAEGGSRSYSVFDGMQPRTPGGGGYPLRGSSSPRSTPSVVLSSSSDPSHLNPPPPLPSANASRYVIRQSLR